MGISLSDERCEEIKQIVVNLFVRYNVNCVPVNGFELATKMGIKIRPHFSYDMKIRELLLKKSEDGFCVERKPNEWFILYNDARDYGRINNTIMHEIGHIILDHSEESELAEKEVRFFAKYALVPPVLVHKFKLKTPEEIVNIFGISYEAACYAYTYYQKWLNYGSSDYTVYERKLLQLFNVA